MTKEKTTEENKPTPKSKVTTTQQTKWGVIYCYLVLFVSICGLMITSGMMISDVHDLYYTSHYSGVKFYELDHLKAQYHEKIKDPKFNWEAKENKKLAEYASSRYRVTNSIRRESFILIMFGFVTLIHVVFLRRVKNDEA